MEINVDLTRDDFADFYNYYYLNRGLKKRIYIAIFIAFAIPLVVNNNMPFELFGYLRAVILTGLIFGAIYFGAMIILLKSTRILPSKNGSILGKKTFTITESGLLEESDSNTNLQKWQGIQSVESNDNSIFIFVDKIAAYVIPKRYFKDPNQQIEFVSIIKGKINNVT